MTGPITWTSDTEFVLDGVKYACWDLMQPGRESTTERFSIIKSRRLVEEYAALLAHAAPEQIVELGIWGGGSTALIAQLARPKKLVAIELASPRCAPLERFIDRQGLRPSVIPYYGVDQTDAARIEEILDREDLRGTLDLVVDDASHVFENTRASFNLLFPHLRAGGLYVIEDWSWAHGLEWDAPGPWTQRVPLSVFLFELMLECAHHPELVEEITIKRGFAVVRRGTGCVKLRPFEIQHHYGPVGQRMVQRLASEWLEPDDQSPASGT